MSKRIPGRKHRLRLIPVVEAMEHRLFLSATAQDAAHHKIPHISARLDPVATDGTVTMAATGLTSPVAGALTPAQMRGAYGVNNISFDGIQGDGTGQTIAIVDELDDPTALSDLNGFSSYYGLPAFNNGTGSPTFTKVNENGGSSLPTSSGNDAVEESIDIEWAHAMAPMANIILVECNSNDFIDLVVGGVNWARGGTGSTKAAHISVVSMSWAATEFAGESSYDTYFTTPTSHQGVTFLAASGDYGAYGEGGTTVNVNYPACSPNVVAVGGTQLGVSGNTWSSEVGWGNGSNSGSQQGGGGSGGGISAYETQPSYQNGVVTKYSSNYRTVPDISMDADTGIAIYDSTDYGSSTPWASVLWGGTSLACPMMAGLVAIADQGAPLAGLATMDGSTQLLPKLYAAASSNFHDITSGDIGNSYTAGTGYDLVTGLGTPITNLLVPALAGLSEPAINNLYVRKDSDGTHLDEWINSSTPGVGTPTVKQVLADASSINDLGASGPDTLTLDYSNGNFASALTQINFTASSTGTIDIVGTSSSDTLAISSTQIVPSGSSIGTTPITFSNVQTISLPGGSGGSDAMNISSSPAGGFTINADTSSGTPNVTVNVSGSGTMVAFASTQHLAALSIASGDQVTLDSSAAPGGSVLVTSGLSLNGTATLNLTNNGMIVKYSGTSPLSTIQGLIESAYSSGTWSGSGITSSLANASVYGVGYGEASAILGAGGGSFLGQSLGAGVNAVLVRYTLYGDANLDGSVNFSDLVVLAQHYASTGTQWDTGDFNYDGSTGFADLVLMAQQYQESLS